MKRHEVGENCTVRSFIICTSSYIIRMIKSRWMRWAGHVASMGKMGNAYKTLVANPEGRRPLGRPRHKWEDNIKMDLTKTRLWVVDWIYLSQDRDRWWVP
jgi:hypothetical protein